MVIELPYSREYIPNSGPMPGAITFAPPADSTAYIIDRILLPPDSRGHDGKPKPRRPTYIVGWRDMPGARVLVPVMDILDYVSPWAVERWEMELETELSIERRRMKEEKQKEKEALAQPNQPQPRKQPNKRGRPPKNAEIETATTAELDSEEVGATRVASNALGFTPQKPALEEFVEISDTEGSPSRQLAAEQGEFMSYETEEGDADVVEYQKAVEDGAELDELPDNVDLGFGDAQNGLGSLPPLELQQTNPDAELTPRPSKIKFQSGSHIQATVSSWVTANKAANKAPALNAPPPELSTLGNAKFPEMSARPSVQDDAPQRETIKAKPKDNTKPKTQKRRQKSVSADKAPAPKKRKRVSEGQLPVDVGGEQQWIVKRLEDAELYTVEGVGLVRYFKVLWEGDWPPDQNPSWEPEENLPPALVRNYYKRSKDRLSKTQKKKKSEDKKQTTLSWGDTKKYESVSEAFAGDEDTDLAAPKEEEKDASIGIEDYGEDTAEDELFVVGQDQSNGTQTGFTWGGQRNGIFGMAR